MINFISPINNQTGYGITGYNLWKHLLNINDITLMPIGPIALDPLWQKDTIINSISKIENYNRNAPCFKNYHAHDLLMRPTGQSKYGAITFFEVDKLRSIEQTNINNLDCVFVASSWAKEILLQNNITTKIVVCPQGVDLSIFNHDISIQKTNNSYKFLNIGKWEIRKGHDILIDIFNKAFDANDDVELVMMNHNPFLSEKDTKYWIDLYKNSKLGHKIKILPRVASQRDVAYIMSVCDCGIFPSRAEGWNNEAIEMLAMNKPIIITDYSAHTQYCTKDNSFLINITSTEEAKDNLWFNGYGSWANISNDQIDQCIQHMRYVYKNKITTNTAGLETAKQHSWQNTVQIISKELLCE